VAALGACAIEDPNPLVRAAASACSEAGIEVEIATEFAPRRPNFNEPFLHFMKTGRPLVTLKAAMTLDAGFPPGR